MTAEKAKEILLGYRPGTDDARDPEVVQALALCGTDAALAQWYREQCACRELLQAKFRNLRAPEGLAQQIVSEQRTRITLPLLRRSALVGVLACLAIAFAVFSMWKYTKPAGNEDLSFNGYRQRMVRTALRAYGMDLETNDVAQVRAYLAVRKAPADFVLPAALAQTPAVGCGVLAWQGRPVTMVCFRTGKPLEVGSKSDLFLFVINGSDLQDSAEILDKSFAQVSQLATASWREGDKVYVLAAFAEEDLTRRL